MNLPFNYNFLYSSHIPRSTVIDLQQAIAHQVNHRRVTQTRKRPTGVGEVAHPLHVFPDKPVHLTASAVFPLSPNPLQCPQGDSPDWWSSVMYSASTASFSSVVNHPVKLSSALRYACSVFSDTPALINSFVESLIASTLCSLIAVSFMLHHLIPPLTRSFCHPH